MPPTDSQSDVPRPNDTSANSVNTSENPRPDLSGQNITDDLKSGQFRISTLLSWTAVTCILLGTVGVRVNLAQIDSRSLLFFGAIFATPLTCIPFLIDQMRLKKNGLKFSLFWRLWITACVGIYSMLALMLATIGFSPEWKGAKAKHWFYYTLDGGAGLTLWPIYAVGAILFTIALFHPNRAKKSVSFLIASMTCSAISFWYVFATLFLKFAGEEAIPIVLIPGACGICYAIYSAIIIRNQTFSWGQTVSQWKFLVTWVGGLAFSIFLKYPLAVSLYNSLPDEAPDGCFIVTAATKGHPEFVGTWHDSSQDCLLNQQLLTFWAFEKRIKERSPCTHQIMRKIYNRVGPLFARMIVFRWQADLVYLSLKPLELLASLAIRRS